LLESHARRDDSGAFGADVIAPLRDLAKMIDQRLQLDTVRGEQRFTVQRRGQDLILGRHAPSLSCGMCRPYVAQLCVLSALQRFAKLSVQWPMLSRIFSSEPLNRTEVHMTLILTALTDAYVALASDRCITSSEIHRNGSVTVKSQEDTNTKSVILDGRYIMGFTVASAFMRPTQRTNA
jgi:hypothetical protein